jgi:hypothetical protein
VTTFSVKNHTDANRYELWVDDELSSYADYVRQGDVVIVPHVETRRDRRGRGNADRLMKGMLDDIRALDLKVRPVCPHAVDYLRDHPEEADLVA